ncbi:hypothetical protein HDC37_003201 [Microbacterium sp. AK009]|uniref:hypothetical protein n=1 Tax=Microbacterium sp. AK009 TaxID=2723068 RepID=UPI0015CE3F9F|nr:hypothetical protein [Microbacterium sp. AK009]NYF18341.1 hypothetical protein [Microbacterium sp. AK009]
MTRDGTIDELRRLRERAWGPAADLADDPAALARLRALEAAAREKSARSDDPDPPAHGPATPTAPSAGAPAAPAAPDAPAPLGSEPESRPLADGGEPAASDLSPASDHPPASDQPPASDLSSASDLSLTEDRRPAEERPPLRAWFPRRRAPWAASLIAAAAIGAIIAVAGATTVERTGGGQQVGTLARDPGFTPPDFLGIPADSLRGFDEFYGLTVVSSDEEWIGGGTDECLLVVGGSVAGELGGEAQQQVFLGCGVGAFAASVSFRVQPRMPAELLERFPEGTPLKFVRQGSDVRVLAGDTP